MHASAPLTRRTAKAALVLGLSACLVAACASKAGAGRGTAAAPAYKVTKRAAALSAAAGDPVALAQATRAQARQRTATAPPRRAESAPARPANKRAAAPPARAASGANAGPASAPASPVASAVPAQPAVVNLQTLTVPSAGAAASPASPGTLRAARAVQDAAASVPAGLRWALYVLAGLALIGALITGVMALVSSGRRRRAARSAWAEEMAAPTAANDPDAPSPSPAKRGRPAPPPPTVTILAANRASA